MPTLVRFSNRGGIGDWMVCGAPSLGANSTQMLHWRSAIFASLSERGRDFFACHRDIRREGGMADCVLIPLQNLGVLALPREVFEAALAEGARLTAANGSPCESAEALLDAEQAAQRLAVSSR